MNHDLPKHFEFGFFGNVTGEASYAPMFLPTDGSADDVLKKFRNQKSFDCFSFGDVCKKLPQVTDLGQSLTTVLLKVDQGRNPMQDGYLKIIDIIDPIDSKRIKTEKMKRVGYFYQLTSELSGDGVPRHSRHFLDNAALDATWCMLTYAQANKDNNADLKKLAAVTLKEIQSAAPTIKPEMELLAGHLDRFTQGFASLGWEKELGFAVVLA